MLKPDGRIRNSRSSLAWNSENPNELWLGYRDRPNGLLIKDPSLMSDSARGRPVSSYVALGDSYSSGTGTRTYISDGTSCQRSVYAYPSLDADGLVQGARFDLTSAIVTATRSSNG